MKRFLAGLTSALLVTSLALPAAALAARGDQERGTGRGQTSGQAGKATTEQIEATPGHDLATTHEEVTPGSGNGQAKGGPQQAGAHASENGTEAVKAHDRVRAQESEEDSGTAKPARTGIANAFDRISANLARAEANVASGRANALPPGLVRAFEKFFGWLGLAPDDAPVDEATSIQDDEAAAGSGDATDAPAP